MGDFDKLIEKQENKDLKNLYASLVKAISDKSGYEVIAEQIKGFNDGINVMISAMPDKDKAEDLKALYALQEKLQTANLQTNDKLLESLEDIIKRLVVSSEQTQQTHEKQIQEMVGVVQKMSAQLTNQYELMMEKAKQDQHAEWEFTTEEVKDNIIRKVKIKRLK